MKNSVVLRYPPGADRWYDWTQFCRLLIGYYCRPAEVSIKATAVAGLPKPEFSVKSNNLILRCMIEITCSFLLIVHRYHLSQQNISNDKN